MPLTPTLASSFPAQTGEEAAVLHAGASLDAAAVAVHEAIEGMVRAWLQARAVGGVTRVTGLEGREWASWKARLPRWLASQLDTVTDRIDVMPHTRSLYFARRITFEDLVGIIRTAAWCNGQPLAIVDQFVLDRSQVIDVNGADGLDDIDMQVAALVEDLRAPGWARREEARLEHAVSTVVTAQDFDGGGMVHADLTPTDFTPFVTMLETKAGPPTPDVPRKVQRAAALMDLCLDWLAGTTRTDEAPARPARPTMVVSVDIATASTDRLGHALRVATGGNAPTFTARMLDAIAAEAKLLVQIVDGRRPLAELVADDIPAAVRRAVTHRDRGCRYPGCRRPTMQTDIHHILPRSLGGQHTVENLLLLCRRHHRQIDTIGWQVDLDPTTARATWTHPTLTDRCRATIPHESRPARTWLDLPDMPWTRPPTWLRPPPTTPTHRRRRPTRRTPIPTTQLNRHPDTTTVLGAVGRRPA